MQKMHQEPAELDSFARDREFWIVFGMFVVALATEAMYGHRLFMMLLLVWILLGLMTFYLFVWSCYIAYKRTRWVRAWLPMAAVLATPTVAVAYHDEIGIRLELALCQISWNSTVADIRAGTRQPSGDWLVDPSHPGPVAYRRSSFISNWSGFIHDAADSIENVVAHHGDVNELFGGRMWHARRLWGHWYYCWFT